MLAAKYFVYFHNYWVKTQILFLYVYRVRKRIKNIYILDVFARVLFYFIFAFCSIIQYDGTRSRCTSLVQVYCIVINIIHVIFVPVSSKILLCNYRQGVYSWKSYYYGFSKLHELAVIKRLLWMNSINVDIVTDRMMRW